MTSNAQRCTGLAVLAAIFAVLGTFMVPAHWGSLWGDRDFTDWSVPIANRLHDGARLYEDGLHSPMPPLPYVLARLLFPHGGNWLDGSDLNYACQTGMILLLFWALAGEVGAEVAMVAALAAIPVYLCMQKTMIYDSMAQLLVAATGIATAGLVRKRNAPVASTSYVRLLLTALPLSLLLLTKQNTGVGALLGVSAALTFLPATNSLQKRALDIAFIFFFTAVLFCLIALALHPFLNFSGLLHDVFLTGSEPKGGPLRLLKSLVIYTIQMGVVAGGLYLLNWIAHACLGTKIPSLKSLLADDEVWFPKDFSWGLWVAALFASALGFGLAVMYAKTGVSLKGTMMETSWGTLVLNAGLCLVLVLIGKSLLQKSQPNDSSHPITPYALVFLCSALFHNLSVMRLRWTVDNNPLVFVALVLVAGSCLRPTEESKNPATAPSHPCTAALLAGFLIFIMWPVADFLTLNIVNCTESWPEVRHLAGARLRPESAGMRKLVETVRAASDPARKDTVLLLPEDPNVEAWLERDRPKLSCAIIFTDQYWDRYVARDFAALQAHPPKVIVIGPRNYWRFFCRGWHVNGAAERLIDQVREKMLAKDYDLKSQQEIAYQGGTDFMDVYVRRN